MTLKLNPKNHLRLASNQFSSPHNSEWETNAALHEQAQKRVPIIESILEAGARDVVDQDFSAGKWEYKLFSSETIPVRLDLLLFDSHCFRWVRLSEHYPSQVRSGVRGCQQSGGFIVNSSGQLKLIFSAPDCHTANAYQLFINQIEE